MPRYYHTADFFAPKCCLWRTALSILQVLFLGKFLFWETQDKTDNGSHEGREGFYGHGILSNIPRCLFQYATEGTCAQIPALYDILIAGASTNW